MKKEQKQRVEKGKLLASADLAARGEDEEANKPLEPASPAPFLAQMISNDAIEKHGTPGDGTLDDSQQRLNELSIAAAIQEQSLEKPFQSKKSRMREKLADVER